MNADEIMKKLGLSAHPKEGGFFIETYRSSDKISSKALPAVYEGHRNYSTCIYYMLNQQLQVVVPQGVWQGCRLIPGGKFALLGCTVAPGFDFNDYSSGIRQDLMETYPEFKKNIALLTHEAE